MPAKRRRIDCIIVSFQTKISYVHGSFVCETFFVLLVFFTRLNSIWKVSFVIIVAKLSIECAHNIVYTTTTHIIKSFYIQKLIKDFLSFVSGKLDPILGLYNSYTLSIQVVSNFNLFQTAIIFQNVPN